MDKMTQYLTRAAAELGLACTAPYKCEVASQAGLVAVAHFPELGGSRGTLVFRSDQYQREAFMALQTAGFAVSSFGSPGEREAFDLESYCEMFNEWGWTSTSKPPPAWWSVADED